MLRNWRWDNHRRENAESQKTLLSYDEDSTDDAVASGCSTQPPASGWRKFATDRKSGCSIARYLVWFLAVWGFGSMGYQLIQVTIPTRSFRHRTDGHKMGRLMEVPSPENLPGGCVCGDSVAEARLMGCKYDSLAAAWLPPHCRDDEITAQFEAEGPNGAWGYYTDPSMTVQLTVEEVSLLADNKTATFWMSARWHMVHCKYYWLKMWKAQFTGITIEPRNNHEGHIRHCAEVMKGPEWLTVAGVALDSDKILED